MGITVVAGHKQWRFMRIVRGGSWAPFNIIMQMHVNFIV